MQQEELARLRAATTIGTSAIAHNRPPRDNDKFIYGFKGGASTGPWPGARRTPSVASRPPSASRCASRGRRSRLRADLTGSGRQRVGSSRCATSSVEGRLRVDRLDVTAGEHLLVSGANGSGKSTLLGVLSGPAEPTRGRCRWRPAGWPSSCRTSASTSPAAAPARRTTRWSARSGRPARPLRDARSGAARPARDPGRAAVGRSTAPAGAGDRRWRPSPTCCCSTSPRTTSPWPWPARSRRPCRRRRAPWSSPRHDRWLRRRWTGAELLAARGGAEPLESGRVSDADGVRPSRSPSQSAGDLGVDGPRHRRG